MAKKLSSDVLRRARHIRLLLMDVDGVLTDGKLYYLPYVTPDGRTAIAETKGFDSHDGMGMRWVQGIGGITLGWVSGRESHATTERARVLGVRYLYQDCLEKLGPFAEILADFGAREGEVAYIGDDLTDLPVMLRVGLPCAPANARPEVKKVARYVTRAPGGNGAVREVVELLLRAQGTWGAVLQKYGFKRGKPRAEAQAPIKAGA
jgi:3-deoxy-D-manno-octulosonate 8-phosphate phosphatase (KDO 8-P phosphatase)